MKKFVIFTFIFLVGLAIFIPYIPVLSITNRKNAQQKLYSVNGCKNGFTISYTHSVNKGRVHDYYKRIEKNQLELYQTQFVSYGAGIPEPEETPGAIFTVTDDGYFISSLNRKLPKLIMAVGIIANHSISIGKNEYFLTDYFAPQTSIILEIKRVNLASIIYLKLRKKFLIGEM